MRHSPEHGVLLALLTTLPSTLAIPNLDMALVARATDYEDEVCHPVIQHSKETIPPCLSLVTIETMCTPNGTTPLALKAHQQCMCTGSFFTEWPFCLQCLFLHGLRSERDVIHYKSILSSASSSLCGAPTPTAEFASIFSSVQAAAPYPTTGDTVSSDRAVSQTAVSLYFTATMHQGPGQVTGEATAATASVLFTAPAITPSTSGAPLATGSGGGGSSKAGGSQSAASTTPSGSAKPSGSGNGAGALRVDMMGALGVTAVVAVGGMFFL